MIYPPHEVDDGFGNVWECEKGYTAAVCKLEVVRPGKVQCELCEPYRASTDAAQSPSTKGE